MGVSMGFLFEIPRWMRAFEFEIVLGTVIVVLSAIIILNPIVGFLMLGMHMMFPIKGICSNSLLEDFLCPLDTPSDPYKISKYH